MSEKNCLESELNLEKEEILMLCGIIPGFKTMV